MWIIYMLQFFTYEMTFFIMIFKFQTKLLSKSQLGGELSSYLRDEYFHIHYEFQGVERGGRFKY